MKQIAARLIGARHATAGRASQVRLHRPGRLDGQTARRVSSTAGLCPSMEAAARGRIY